MNRILRHIELKEDRVTPDAFPFTIPAVRNMGKLEFDPACTFFVGENEAVLAPRCHLIQARHLATIP